jgi:acyl-CoA synthetase (AMP-forming)/AMP-acid ligase II
MLLAARFGTLTEPLSGRHWDRAVIARQIRARVAAYHHRGLQRGDRVFLGYGNRLELFADLIAVWLLGGCAVPIDARLTPFEVENLARAGRPRLFIGCGAVDESLQRALSALGTTIVDTASAEAEAAAGAPGSISDRLALDDDALILFTSGTTGNPKGVVHTHRSLRARWITLQQSLGVDRYERTLCLLPTHFGHGLICNCLFPWLSGQDLFILPPFTPDAVMRLGGIVDEHRITFMSSVPAVWRLALKTARPPQGGTLQRVFCGSAPLSGHLWREVQRWTGTREVCNSYGITETGSWVAGTTVPDLEPDDGLIGVPWGAEVAVTRDGNPDLPPGIGAACATGESGFVWLNTPALMRGYLDRDDLTAQVVRNGWFLTGDLGFVDARGYLYLRGRVRDEINKGGVKVYPADIEAVAEQSPSVTDLCCFAVDDPHYGQNVGLALVLADSGDEAVRALYGRLRERLAEHQMPVRWFLLDAIPRTSRGKVNRDIVAEACRAATPIDIRRILRS